LQLQKNKNKIFKIVIKSSILIIILVLAYINIDFVDLLNSFQKFNFLGFVLSMFFCFLSCFFVSKRWVYSLKNKISFQDGLESTFVCLGLNNILPGKIGEFLQLMYLKKVSNFDISNSFPFLLVLRLMDVGFLLVFMLIGSYFNQNIEFSLFLFILVLGILFIIILFKYNKFLLRKSQFIKHNKLKKLYKNLIKVIVKTSASTFIKLLFYTLIIWFLYFLYLYIFVIFGTNFNLSFYEILIVFIFISIGMAIPLAPGGIGTAHIGAIISLGFFGISKSDALAFGIIFHLVQFIPTTIIGFFLFYNKYLKYNFFDKLKGLKRI